MNKTELMSLYEKDGIIILKNFFSREQIEEYRKLFLHTENQNLERRYIPFEEIPHSLQLLEDTLNKRLKKVLNEIFEDPILVPDFILQINNTPKKLLIPHYDSQSYIRHGLKKELPNLQCAKLGLYFQDNDSDHSGGIWAIKGSHKYYLFRIVWRLPIMRNFFDKLIKKFYKNKQKPIDISSGDLAIFDGRLLHSSSPVSSGDASIKRSKYAFYFSCAGNLSNARSYMKTETIKFAEEIKSNNKDDCQRIGYFFSDPLLKWKNNNKEKNKDWKIFELNKLFIESTK
tara:strand:- start:4702 stop:5559 length:858 start_codon:yes stop_codon:yes gene_type:complete